MGTGGPEQPADANQQPDTKPHQDRLSEQAVQETQALTHVQSETDSPFPTAPAPGRTPADDTQAPPAAPHQVPAPTISEQQPPDRVVPLPSDSTHASSHDDDLNSPAAIEAKQEILSSLFDRITDIGVVENPDPDMWRTLISPDEPVAVIGFMADLGELRAWTTAREPGTGNLVAIPPDNWSPERNDAWVREVIQQGLPVWMMSNLDRDNIWKPHPEDPSKFQETITRREFLQFMAAGYRIDGHFLVPPHDKSQG